MEVMKKIELVLEVAMTEKGKTLRPEIQLMNKVLLMKFLCHLMLLHIFLSYGSGESDMGYNPPFLKTLL